MNTVLQRLSDGVKGVISGFDRIVFKAQSCQSCILTDKQLSAKISRQLGLLRDHSLIRKLPRQRRYRLTTRGRQISIALSTMLSTSIKELMEIAA